MEEEEKSLKEVVKELSETIKEDKEKKVKKFKLPFKSRVGKSKLKKGFVTICLINENKEVDFIKRPIEDAAYNIKDSFHAVEGKDIFTYKGKPFVIQPKSHQNPWNPLREINQTYGHKYIMAKMKSDFIKAKAEMKWGVAAFGAIVLGVIAYAFITGGS